LEQVLPNTKLSHYRIISKLGEGGMGEVYLAQDESELGRMVALKILPSEVASDKDRLQRFTQEARTVSNLNHPNILTVHEFGQTDFASFIATEYVEGITLREYLSQRRLKLMDVLEVVIQIVAALNAAHEAGVTHRDLKPENVMVRRDHIVKVLDFGLAKLTEPHVTVGEAYQIETNKEAETKVFVRTDPGKVMGTVSYMSPEQSMGKRVDQRTDIWSVGVVLYEMIAGSVPFQEKDIHRTIIAIQESEPAPISQQVEGVPERLEEIVAKCLAKDKDERYQTARDLLIDLRNLRRRLDLDAEIERSVAPLRSTRGTPARTSSSQPSAAPTGVGQGHPTSSAEYVVSGLKRHKIVAATVVIALATAALALALYLRARNSKVAIESIAVLPFDNQNRDPNTDYLSDGLTDSIINSLTQLPNLKVTPRSSVFRYKDEQSDPIAVARALGVRAILTGRIMQRGDSLTVGVELLDARDNKQIWGDQYNRKLADALAVQQEISREITEHLRLKLTGEEQKQLTKRDTSNPEAFQFYLKGRYYWNKRTAENIKRAMEQFQQAADKDPNYALAYVGLSDCYIVLEEYSGTPSSETIPKAKAFAERALQLDSSVAEAHTSLAYIHHLLWEWEEADKAFKRAIELNPNYPTVHHWYSLHLYDIRRHAEGCTEIKRANELDPLSLVIASNVANCYLIRGDLTSVIEESNRIIELDPNFPRGHETLGWAYLLQGRHPEAITEIQKAIDLSFRRDRRPVRSLGYAYAMVGKRAEALAILRELQEKYGRHEGSALDVAVIYAGLGDKDQAFAWLERGFQDRSSRLARMNWELGFESLRSDPRFADLVRRMGLKP
jgi:serine/threonine protein kinase/tetratricopeptide (TPR) repeat protein